MEEEVTYEFLITPYNTQAVPYLHSSRSDLLNAKRHYDFLVYSHRGTATVEAWQITTRKTRELMIWGEEPKISPDSPHARSI